jgi:protein TonB
MASISVADQLEDAIEMMIAEPDSAVPKVDLKIGELLGIAAGLRLLPDPEFRAALKLDLLRQTYDAPGAVREDECLQENDLGRARYGAGAREILPTLFGSGSATYPVHRENFAISAAIHAALFAMVATAGFWMTKPRPIPHATTVLLMDVGAYALPPSVDRNRSGGGGGGGDKDKLPESKGSLPRFSHEQESPPTVVVLTEQPKLPAEPTVVGPPALTVLPSSQIGNPLSAMLEPSNGAGTGGRVGNGSGGGIGVGHGPGVGPGYGGGIGGGAFRVGGGVSAPRAIYDPDPEYSEEARRTKLQGTVILWVVVGADGRPRDIRVQRSLGMGLDEKAIEAVRQWKFEPSVMDGQPVAVQINIEVNFHLY